MTPQFSLKFFAVYNLLAKFIAEKNMTDYDMASGVGRTYKYYSKQPVYPFGFGLSYTTFTHRCSLRSGHNDRLCDLLQTVRG